MEAARRPTGAIDVAVIQSLNKKGVVADLVADYGQVIVDECHHLSAFSFEQVLKQVRAKYVVGLTATPVRETGTSRSSPCSAARYGTARTPEAKPKRARSTTGSL